MRILTMSGAVVVLAASLSAVSLARPEGRADEPSKAPQPVESFQTEDVGPGEAGLAPTNQLGVFMGPPRLPKASPPPDQGIHVSPDSDAKGDALRLQRKFAEALARQDAEPESRSAHFAWLPERIHVKGIVGPNSLRFEWIPNAEPNVWRVGWWGSITEANEQPDGGALVTVKIQPRMHSTSVKTLMADYVMETYRFADGRLKLIATDAATPRRNLQRFPIMN